MFATLQAAGGIFAKRNFRKSSEIITFRVQTPFFRQQKKNNFLSIFFVVPTGKKMKDMLPSGIRANTKMPP
jgi:hypothetical protein